PVPHAPLPQGGRLPGVLTRIEARKQESVIMLLPLRARGLSCFVAATLGFLRNRNPPRHSTPGTAWNVSQLVVDGKPFLALCGEHDTGVDDAAQGRRRQSFQRVSHLALDRIPPRRRPAAPVWPRPRRAGSR